MDSNQIINNLPNHLKSFIVDQEYERYSPQDHSVWRAVMKQNTTYLKKVAYSSYLKGLKKSGITINRIPTAKIPKAKPNNFLLIILSNHLKLKVFNYLLNFLFKILVYAYILAKFFMKFPYIGNLDLPISSDVISK